MMMVAVGQVTECYMEASFWQCCYQGRVVKAFPKCTKTNAKVKTTRAKDFRKKQDCEN